MQDKKGTEKQAVVEQKKKVAHTFVEPTIRANKPYGIIRKRQEQMDKVFGNK